MDNNLNQRILAYAVFDDIQENEIRHSVDLFFDWHRRNELPRYAELIAQIEAGIKDGSINDLTIMNYMENIRQLAETGFKHSPIAGSAKFLKALSDQQVQQIAEHFEEQDKEFFEWLEQRKTKSDKDDRVKTITKNVSRFGVTLNKAQQQIIAAGLKRYEGSPLERFEVWNRWEATFVQMLAHRSEVGFEDKINAHLDAYQSQMRLAYPKRQQRNRENSARILYQVIEDFDPQQKATLARKLAQARKTLLSISAG